ncbi:MAG: hypothetical protein OEU32_14015 [Acidimicrobiia bacterium]|nr:hypothetical protein [Acidimicrobiia bacterium]
MSKCPACGATLIEIDIDQHGQAFTMQSCSGCDTRTWQVDGAPSRLPSVLRSLGDECLPVSPTAI